MINRFIKKGFKLQVFSTHVKISVGVRLLHPDDVVTSGDVAQVASLVALVDDKRAARLRVCATKSGASSCR